jgi:hypothetical protein
VFPKLELIESTQQRGVDEQTLSPTENGLAGGIKDAASSRNQLTVPAASTC